MSDEKKQDQGMTFPEFKRRMKIKSKNELIQILFNAFVHNFQLQKRVNELTEADVPAEELNSSEEQTTEQVNEENPTSIAD